MSVYSNAVVKIELVLMTYLRDSCDGSWGKGKEILEYYFLKCFSNIKLGE